MTHRRQRLLGDVANDEMALSPAGHIVDACWRELPARHGMLDLDAFVVMPDHLHDLVGIGVRDIAPLTSAARFPSLSEIVRGFKTASATRVNDVRGRHGAPLWQRSFYDRVIRHERDLDRARAYIEANPANWRPADHPDKL